VDGSRPPYDGYPRGLDETERFSVGERPWYLKRWVLALWGLTVVILIVAIIWGLAILARGNGGSAPAPTTTRTTTTTSTTTPTPSTTEPTTTTPSEETTIEPVPTSTWTPQHPRRHWWRSNLHPVPPVPPIPHF
jgi:cytoskeletal protein RodZ